jgi:hypothetical protein
VVAFLVFAIGMHVPMFLAKVIPREQSVIIIAAVALGMVGVAVGLVLLCFAVILTWRIVIATPKSTAIEYLRTLRLPIGIVVANVTVGLVFHELWSEWAFNAVRLAAIAFAGWTLGRSGSSIWKSAAAGLLLFLLDHVVIKGGWFLLNLEWEAFGGVLLSFAMYAFVPLAVAAIAGMVGKRMPPSNPTVEPDAHEAARGSP